MAFQLHGFSLSTCTRRVALIAKERNVQYELIPVDVKVAEHKQPPHLEHQPFGQVPYITVRHLSFFLSYAVSRYINFSFLLRNLAR
jgi:glutathione S-transferase